jgi:cellulose synthase-like protein
MECAKDAKPYKNTELDQVAVDNEAPLPPSNGGSKMERRVSLKSKKYASMRRSQTGDFDHNRWLFETKGTYGFGNAIWPKEGDLGNGKDGHVSEPTELMSRQWRPLTRKIKIPAAVLSPYRYQALLLFFLCFFF